MISGTYDDHKLATPPEYSEGEREEDDGEPFDPEAFQAAIDADVDPLADPDCPICHGTGIVTERHPYGSTTAAEHLLCDCVVEEEAKARGETELSAEAGCHPPGVPVYSVDGGETFTASQYAEDNDDPLDPRIVALEPGQSVSIDFGAAGVAVFTRHA